MKLKLMSDKQFKILKAMKEHMLKKKPIEINNTKHLLEKIKSIQMQFKQLMKPQNLFNIYHSEQHLLN